MTTFPHRTSGILLHPTSLPGIHGIGDLGRPAFTWLDFLAETRTELWQILPLGPTGYGDSPYQCFSAFAGNPYLVSPELLVDDGLLDAADLDRRPELPVDRVDFGRVIPWKLELLNRAFERFSSAAPPAVASDFDTFREEHATWVEDYGFFMALKDLNDLRPWWTWDDEVRTAEPGAMKALRTQHGDLVRRHVFRQFLFFRQWQALREQAAALGIRIVGDIPIFVAADSADVWSHPDLFTVNDDRTAMEFVAGVPPDYFSATGQLWGNPLYRWDRHAETGYAWWLERLRATLGVVDILRIDHFRGFADYWEIPGDAPTAETGQWLDGPGTDFFDEVSDAMGSLPIIAEDLGDLSPAVPKLLRYTGFPGMTVLQFGFDSDETDPFLPHNHEVNSVAYTGTHDNDTGLGWWNHRPEAERPWPLRYLDCDGSDISAALNEGVWQSRAQVAVTPLQTLLKLDTHARMNMPGTAGGNWQWRFAASDLTDQAGEELAGLNSRYQRNAPGLARSEDADRP